VRGLREWEAGALLAACLVGAMWLRVWGMWQGYPEVYGHVDQTGWQRTYGTSFPRERCGLPNSPGGRHQVQRGLYRLRIRAATGVSRIRLSATEADTFIFIDSAGDSQLTLGNGVITQALSISTILDGSSVATGTTAIANSDHLGTQVTLAGPNQREPRVVTPTEISMERIS